MIGFGLIGTILIFVMFILFFVNIFAMLFFLIIFLNIGWIVYTNKSSALQLVGSVKSYVPKGFSLSMPTASPVSPSV
jgi:hypothetical protein